MAETGAEALLPRIDALRARGAAGIDPAGLRYLDALARRVAACAGARRRQLEERLEIALVRYEAKFAHAEEAAREALADAAAAAPHLADGLHAEFEARNFVALRRAIARQSTRGGAGPLAELLAEIGDRVPHTSGWESVRAGAGEGAPAELKAVRFFRRTWAQLSVDRQLSEAFARAPDNAGPLNSHFLVLQALRQMREIAPAYLEHYLSYADALLWLEQADGGRSPAPKTTTKPAPKSGARSSVRGGRKGPVSGSTPDEAPAS